MKDWCSLMVETPPLALGFAHGALDRAAHLRGKPEVIAALFARADARVHAFCGDVAVLPQDGSGVFAAAALPMPESIEAQLFLGLEGDAPVFAVVYRTEAEAALQALPGLTLLGLRALAMERVLSPETLGAMATGKALAHWHGTHRFCARCGQPSKAQEAGWKRVCDACTAEHFPRTDPVVIMLTLDGDTCLLGRSPRFPPGVYSSLAGFVEPGETIEAAVRRETWEEAGIRTGRVHLIANQPWPFPASLMIGAYAEALNRDITIDREELEDCRWFSRAEVKRMIAKTHEAGFLIPPRMAIANHLIRHWVES